MFNAIALEKAPQGTDAWRAARKRGIGGSDAAAALGIDEYKTPLQLYQDKLSLVPDFEGNWYTERGSALEPVLRKHYAEKFGMEVRVPEHILQHSTHQFMICSLDGFTDNKRVQEFKTSMTSKGWGQEGTDEIPQKYLVQVQHNLIVTGFEVADVSVSIGGGEPKYYEVPADKELQQLIIDGEARFWEMVKNRQEPEPKTIEEMQRKYNIERGRPVVGSNEIIQAYVELTNLREHGKNLDAEIEQRKEQIQAYLLQNGADTLLGADGSKLITWIEGKPRETFDAKNFASAYPDLHKQFIRVGNPSRTFLVK